MQQHFQASNRKCYIVNLDPAAENFGYEMSIDIRDLISLEDVTTKIELGPNGGLIYCMEYFMYHLDWLEKELDEVHSGDDAYFIFDCPGQIELLTHIPVMKKLCDSLQQWGYVVCSVFLLDSVFLDDPSKYISGVMLAMSTMLHLEVPHLNVISKCDLIPKELIDEFLEPDTIGLREKLKKRFETSTPKFQKMNESICQLLEDYSMVNFIPLNANDEDSVDYLLAMIDHATNYGDDVEPKDSAFLGQDGEDEGIEYGEMAEGDYQ